MTDPDTADATPDEPASGSDVAPDERHDQNTEPERSDTYRLLTWAVDNLMLLLGGLILVIAVGASVFDWTLTRGSKIILMFTGGSLLIVGRPVGQKARDLLFDPRELYLIDVDARYAEASIYRMPSQRFTDWTVDDGSLDWVSPGLAFGKNVDAEAQTVEGCWRGTLTDRELMRALANIKECRGQLEDDAKRGFAIEAQAWAIIRNATRKTVMSVVNTFEEGTLPDRGDGVGSAIDDAISEYDLDERMRDFDDDLSPDGQQDVPGDAFSGSEPQGSDPLDPEGRAAADD